MYKSSKIRILLSSLVIVTMMVSSKSDDYKKNLLLLKDANGNTRAIKDAAEWYKRREQILDSIQLVMGPLPDRTRRVPLDIKVEEESNVAESYDVKFHLLLKKMTVFQPTSSYLSTGKNLFQGYFVFIRQSELEKKNRQDWAAVRVSIMHLSLPGAGM